MSILSIIFWIISNLPTFLTLVKAIIDFIHGIKDPKLHAQAMSEFTEAFNRVKTTKDAKPLNDFADKWCVGVACPPDLVK